MIVASLLLILVAVGLIVAGLALASNWLLATAILACGVAAFLVYRGSRAPVDSAPISAEPPPVGEVADPEFDMPISGTTVPSGHLGGAMFSGPGNPVLVLDNPQTHTTGDTADHERETSQDEGVGKEPPAQVITSAARARLARSTLEVLVVDGRPRYHVSSCAYLADVDSEPLPVSEAQALGFTPCALCEPATTLVGF